MKKIILSLVTLAVATLSFSQYFVEDFENGGVFPSGWGLSNGVDDWAIDMGDNYGPGSAQSGTYSAYFNDWSYTGGTTADMISPKIDLSTATNPELVFWYQDGGGSDVVEVLTSIDSSFFVTGYTTSATVGSWTKITVDMTPLAGQSNVWISFRGLSVYGSTNPHVDNIVVQEAPTCPDPSALSATIIRYDSVSINWTENAGASSWYISYGVSPITANAGTKVLTNNPDTLTGLLANTSYSYYVKSICGTGDSSTWVGPYNFNTPPTCPDPSSLSATVISSDSVSIDWTENAGATSWYISYGVSPINANAGTKILTNNPDTLIGLTASTNYQYYVKSICGAGDSSDWVGPYSFTTACPSFFTPPFAEDFNSYIPNCWSEATGELTASSSLTVGSSDWEGGSFGYIGSNSALVNIFSNAQYEWLLSPVIDLGTGAYQAEFDIALTVYADDVATILDTDDSVAFVISTDAGATWTSANILELWDVNNNTLTPTGTHIIVDLSSYTGQVMFGFYGSSSINSIEDNDLYIDNFEVKVIPSCPQPVSLSITTLTATTADLNWIEGGTATQWHVEYDTTGFTVGTSINSFVNNTNNPYNASGLTANTNYDFYVRAICGAGDTSTWSGPFNFSTLCAPVTGDSLSDPILITGLTYSNTVDNNCYTNQYVGRSGNDVIYKIALDACIDSLVLSTCGSDYDTYLYVLENDKSTVAGFNDDSFANCGSGGNSYLVLTTADFSGGDTLYIVLDGYDNTELGNAILDVEQKLQIIDYTLTLVNDTAFAVVGATSYQWLDCDAGDTLITGATNNYYKAPVAGNYSVIITNGTCSDTSACILIASTSVNELSTINFNVFPNPNNGEFTISTKGNEIELTVDVMNTVGQVVYSSKLTSNNVNINLSNVAKGSYIVRVYNSNTSTQEMLIVK